MADRKQTKNGDDLCPVCFKRDRKGSLICSLCISEHRISSEKKIINHQKVETRLEFAIRRTSENLAKRKEELDEKIEITRPFFSKAHEEVKSECRTAGLHYSKGVPEEHAKFMELVNARYREIMKKAGQEGLYNDVERLKKEVRVCASDLAWYKKIQAREAKKAEEVKTDVPQNAAVVA